MAAQTITVSKTALWAGRSQSFLVVLFTLFDSVLQDKDSEKSKQVMKAIFQMHKLEIRRLKEAYEQR